MVLSKRKQPFSVEHPRGVKNPKVQTEAPLYDDRKATWRVGKIQVSDPYGWHALNSHQIHQVKERLSSFEGSTWKEIFVRDARANHRIAIDDLKCEIAKAWMKKAFPDQTYLWTLRFSNTERVWGILAEGAYQIIFWDPFHKIWEISKK